MKKSLLFVLIFLCSISIQTFSQANDLCANATLIVSSNSCASAGNNVSGTLAAGTTYTSIGSACGTANAKDIWFKFVARSNNPTITINSAPTQAQFQLYSASSCGGTVTSLGCVAGSSGTPSTALVIDSMYLIRVYSNNNSTGTFSVCVTDPVPANDACANAISITPNFATPTIGNMFRASQTSITGSCGNYYDVWYKFTVPSGSTFITVNTTLTNLPTNLTLGGTYVEVFNTATCPGTSNSMGCYDITMPAVLGNLTAGNTYILRVHTNGTNPNGTGSYRFNISVTAGVSNDECINAVTIAPGVPNYMGSVFGMTTSTGTPAIPAPCSGTADDDAWYKFVAGATNATVSITGSLASNGARVQVFSGSCGGTFTQVGCGAPPLYLSGLTAGTTYYVRVFSNVAGNPGAGNSPFFISVTPLQPTTAGSGRMNEVFRQTILSGPSILNDPWEVTYGPDGMLWVTEARGYKVQRIDPTTGVFQTVLDLTETSSFTAIRRTFNSTQNPWPQGGMMGLAIHPKFMTDATKKFVYVAYVRSFVGTDQTVSGESIRGDFFRTSIVRFTFDGTSLVSPQVMCDTIRGSSDHNSGRMIIAPYNGDTCLYYACGDMGGGQFGNIEKVNKAQDTLSVEGKILRFNLESDNDRGASPPAGNYDNWVPNNNPYNKNGSPIPAVQNFVWAIGLRNNQGFAYAKINGVERLYGSSHGPFSDDELNIIERKKNYGHPHVIGYNDGNYNGSRAGQTDYGGKYSRMPIINTEQWSVDSLNALTTDNDWYRNPIYSFYDTAKGNTGIVNSIAYIYSNTNSAYYANGSWASEAPSGLDIYTKSLIPGWKNSILLASLKKGRMLRLRLNPAGTAVIPIAGEDTVSYFGGMNRYRDLAYSPDGKDMYIVIDKSSTTSGPTSNSPVVSACGGCLQKYTFLGYNVNAGNSNRSYIPTTIDVALGKDNTCEVANTVTINSANGNNNLWVPITDTNSNVIAEIYAMNKDLGDVTTTIYHKVSNLSSNPVRTILGRKYLDRNITITPQNQPGGNVKIRLYITKAEYDTLRLTSGSNINNLVDLKIVKNNDPCSSAMTNTASIVPLDFTAEAFGPNAYVLQGTIGSFSTFYFGSAAMGTLPVQLLTFKGVLQDNATQLLWETSQEVNTSYFSVERSIDGNNFTAIGNVSATGNSTTPVSYHYTDNEVMNLPATIVYYRLKMVDKDGSFTYSSVVSVTLPYVAGKITVAPNPVIGEAKVTIASAVNGKVLWRLVDNSGRVLLQGAENVRPGNNQVLINMHKLSAGMYFLSISGAGLDQQVKLQKN